MLNGLPEQARDEAWKKTSEQPGFLFSRTLKRCAWPGLELVGDDMVGFVRELKQDKGPELRVLGSISIMRQLVEAGLLDGLRLTVCPLVLPKTGVERIFEGFEDTGFELASTKVLDGRVLVLEYRPAGAPPTAQNE
jgi:dihydrofolate reductase